MQRQLIRGGRKFWADQTGPTITEYAVLLAFIIFGVFATITLIGVFVKNSFTTLSNGIPES